jgi:hypothetical protein
LPEHSRHCNRHSLYGSQSTRMGKQEFIKISYWGFHSSGGEDSSVLGCDTNLLQKIRYGNKPNRCIYKYKSISYYKHSMCNELVGCHHFGQHHFFHTTHLFYTLLLHTLNYIEHWKLLIIAYIGLPWISWITSLHFEFWMA